MDITVKATLSTGDTTEPGHLNSVLEALIRANNPLAGRWEYEKTGTFRTEKASLIEISGIPGNDQVVQHLQHALRNLFGIDAVIQFAAMGSVVYNPDAMTAAMHLLKQRMLFITTRRRTYEASQDNTPLATLIAVDH